MDQGLEVLHCTYTNNIKVLYEQPNLENWFMLYITNLLFHTSDTDGLKLPIVILLHRNHRRYTTDYRL